ncbi:hypothetical protein ACQP1U_18555 [Actinomycetota bacterium]
MTTRRTPTGRAAIGLALAAAIALTGCSGGDDAPASGSSSAAGQTTSTGGDGSGSESNPASDDAEQKGSAAEAGLDANNLPKPLSSMTIAGDDSTKIASIKVDLVQVERREKLLKVVLGMTPTMEGDAADERVNVYNAFGRSSPKVRVIDGQGLKLYESIEIEPGRRTESDSVASPMFPDKTTFWHAFVPYPEGAQKVDILFHDAAPAFTGVTVPQ